MLDKIKQETYNLITGRSKYRNLLMSLAVVVVFVTTYLLILPALTLDKDKAAEQGGIDVPAIEEVSESETAGVAASSVEMTEAKPGNDGKSADESGSSARQETGSSDAGETKGTDSLTFEGENYNIAVTDTNSILPENTEIKVEEIDEKTDEKAYKRYYDDALKAVRDEKGGKHVADFEFARFYDISLESDGREVNPNDTVSVKIEYEKKLSKTLGVENKDNIRIIHFAKDEKTGEVKPEVLDADKSKVEVKTDNKDKLEEASFEADSFSVYAVVYTVDFEWDGHTFSIPGGTWVWLSDLLEVLNMDVDIANVKSVELSDETLLSVERIEATEDILTEAEDDSDSQMPAVDWRLTSLRPFTSDEELLITLYDGTSIIIKTTDPESEELTYHTDLANLLKNLEMYVDGELVEEGSTVDVREGMLYDLVLSFQEKGNDQFSNTDQMYFNLPEGFVLPDDYSEKLTINLGLDGKVYDNILSYDKENNRLLLDWNKNDRKFQRLIAAGNLRFSVRLQGYITPGDVRYGDSFHFVANKYDPHNASVAKAGVLDDSDIEHQRMTYTVKVTSDGTNERILLTDVMGSALSYVMKDGVPDVTWERESTMSSQQAERARGKSDVKTDESDSEPYIRNTAEGFAITIPDMHDGDIYTFTYSADVDYRKISNSGEATPEEMANTAEIYGDDDTIDNKAVWHQKDVVYSDLTKDTPGPGKRYEADGKSYQDIPWTISTNTYKMISFAGTDITDITTEYEPKVTAGDERQVRTGTPLRYSGDGITINVYEWNDDKTDREFVETRTVPWSELNVSDDLDPRKGWTYHVPETDGIYEYEISYVTQAEVTDLKSDTMLKNDAHSRGGNDRATTLLHPPGRGLAIHKQAISFNEEETTWEITVTLDDIANGFNAPLVLTDLLPTKWSDYFSITPRRDTLKPGSVEIIGLYEDKGESYEIYYSEYKESKDSDVAADGNVYVKWNYRNEHRYWDGTYGSDGNKEYPIDDGGRNALYIHFFQDEGKTINGLGAPEDGGETRSFKVRLTTYNNPEWTKDAWKTHNLTSNYLLKHENNAFINNAHELDEVTLTGKHLYKKFKDRVDWGDWVRRNHNHISEKEGNWIFRFETYVSGVYPGDNIVIEDEFDTDLFTLLQPNDAQTYRAGYSPHYAGTVTWKYQDSVNAQYGAKVEQTDKGVRFTIENPPLKPDGSAYPFYGVEYHLIIKDQEAFNKIQKLALDAGGIAQFINTAKYKDMEDSDTYTVEILPEFKPVVKSDPQPTTKQQTVEYSIVLNQKGDRLNNGNPITMEDTFGKEGEIETLSIDYSTIQIVTEPAGREDLVSYDYSGYTGTFIIPDETKVTITYQAKVIPPKGTEWDKDDKASIAVYNVATMLGWSDGGKREIEVEKEAGGTIYRIRAFKYGSGHMERGLNGAVFGLYEKTGEDENGNPVYAPICYQKGEKKDQPITFETKRVQMLNGVIQNESDLNRLTEEERSKLVTLDGYADVQLNQNEDGVYLDKGHAYYLLEETAPEGYVNSNVYYSFTFDEDANYGAGVWTYYNNDILKVRNSPTKGAFTIKKNLAGNYELNDELKAKLRFTVTKKDGEAWRPVAGAEALTYEQIKDGYRISNLEPGEYRIVESMSDGATLPAGVTNSVTYTVDELDADLVDGSIVVDITQEEIDSGAEHAVEITNIYTQEVVTLKASKKWVDAEGLTRIPSGAYATLGVFILSEAEGRQIVIDKYGNEVFDADGIFRTSAAPVQTVTLDGTPDVNSSKTTGESASWTAQFAGLPKFDAAGNEITYVVIETAGPEGFEVTYSYRAASGAEVGGSGENGTDGYEVMSSNLFTKLGLLANATVTNKQETVAYNVSKTWQHLSWHTDNSGSTTYAPEGASVTLGIFYGTTEAEAVQKYKSGAKAYKSVTLPDAAAESGHEWEASFESLPKADGSGTPYVWILAETAGIAGYSAVDQTGTSDAPQDYIVLSNAESTANTLQNKEDSAEITFGKTWRNNGNGGEWAKDANGNEIPIVVALYRTGSTGAGGSSPIAYYKLTSSSITQVADEAGNALADGSPDKLPYTASALAESTDDGASQPDASGGSGGNQSGESGGQNQDVFKWKISEMPAAVDGKEVKYFVREVTRLDGYNDPAYGRMQSNGEISAKVTGNTDRAEDGEYIINTSGVELPHAGGIGTTLFYVIGALLFAGCGIALVARRRTSH